MTEEVNCKDCIWHTEDGCWSWNCDPVTREQAKEMVDFLKRGGIPSED